MNKIFDAPAHEAKEFKTLVEYEKWSRENFKKPPLSTKEQAALKDYENPKRNLKSLIHDYLKESNGKLIDKNDSNYNSMNAKLGFGISGTNIEVLNDKIQEIDKVIDKIKMPESIFIHERTDETRLKIAKNSLRDSNGKILSSKLGDLTKNVLNKKMSQTDYLIGDLVKSKESDTSSVLFRYHIPKNTHGAFFTVQNMLNLKWLLVATKIFTFKEYRSLTKVINKLY